MPTRTINSQSPYRILKGESIIAALWSNAATLLGGRWRVVYDDGTTDLFTFDEFTTGSSRATQLMDCGVHVAEKDGVVVGGMMTYGGGQASVQRGQIYVIVFISGNPQAAGPTDIRSTLACGYMPPISGGAGVCFGTFIEAGPAGGHGAITRVNKAATGVGAGLVLAVIPTGAMWRWICGQGSYTASATVGTRAVRFRFRDGSANIYVITGTLAPTANQVVNYEFAANYTSETTVSLQGLTSVEFPSPDRHLPATHDLFVLDSSNIDVADTVTLEGIVEEWVMPN